MRGRSLAAIVGGGTFNAMADVLDLMLQTFGRLRVLSRAPSAAERTHWLCLCACGNKTIVRGEHLRNGHTRSCGCLRAETQRQNGVQTQHGHTGRGSRSPTYRSWDTMRQRCTNSNHPRFADWGGRGITVCDRWRKFENFLADMGERPEGLTLDRIDNEGNYEPGNCRWATRSEQNRNKRRSPPAHR